MDNLADPIERPKGFFANVPNQIKAADKGAAYLEATLLAGFAEPEARRLFGRDPGLPRATVQDYLTPWSAAKAEKRAVREQEDHGLGDLVRPPEPAERHVS